MTFPHRTIGLALLALSCPALAQSTTLPSTAPAADPMETRAATVAKAMRFADAEKTQAVTTLTADYLRRLRVILDRRQAELQGSTQGKESRLEIDKQSAAVWKTAREAAIGLRNEYVAKLAPLMTPYQVDRIKDGLTADWLPRVTQIYDEMIPGLTYPQRAQILTLLTEMRENAMLETNSGPQEQWVNKYRGIINNYIARQGHDFSALAKAYNDKHDAKK